MEPPKYTMWVKLLRNVVLISETLSIITFPCDIPTNDRGFRTAQGMSECTILPFLSAINLNVCKPHAFLKMYSQKKVIFL